MALVEAKTTRNRCIICGSKLEKSNMGSVCNQCKDGIKNPKQKKQKKE